MNDALQAAVALVKKGEGCRLTAYPDPIWRDIPRSPTNAVWGRPWTIGWGETLGVREGDVWTQEEADKRLEARVTGFVLRTLKSCPQLHLEPPERTAACVSLAYNIGSVGFAGSSVCAQTRRSSYSAAGNAFLLWNKAGGKVMRGLTLRRQRERTIYLG